MSSTQKCPHCGTALPAGTPPWLCPTCLLRQAAEPAPVEEPAPEEAATVAASSTELAGDALPRRLGAYELLEVVGRGGMGVVYKARQLSLDRHVAVKVLSLNALVDRETVHRFRTEAVTAGSLQHPNIVAVHEVGLAEGQHYLVMDYVAGRTLADLVRTGPLPARPAAQYVRTIADAVHFAHERGILHRDLKPSNVLIDENDQPRVTDFGLAKRLDTGVEFTLSGQVLGSPAFIPPEQASGQRGRIGRRSDVYALGAILYQLLTGRPPFVGEALADTLRQVLDDEPLRPGLLNPSVPRDLETICLKCLEKEPDRRYPTAQALGEELQRWLDNRPLLARPLGPVGKVGRWCRRKPLVAALAASLALAVVGGFLGVLSQLHRAQAARLMERRHAYAADMNLVQQALAEGKLGEARDLLDRYRPPTEAGVSGQQSADSSQKSEIRNPKSAFDLRGWEWRYLWGQSRGEEREVLRHHSNAVSTLAFSGDGRWLAVRWEQGIVEVLDAATRQPVAGFSARTAKGFRWRNKTLAISPGGDRLAWGDADANGTPLVHLQDLNAARALKPLPHSADLVSLAFSPDGQVLASLDDDGVVLVWDLATRCALTSFQTTGVGAFAPAGSRRVSGTSSRTHTDHCGCVAFSPDGRWLAVGDAGPRVRLWDWPRREELQPLALPAAAGGVTALAFSPDSAWLAAGSVFGTGTIHVWDLRAGTERRLVGHRAWISGLAFSPDGQELASTSVDQTLRLWDVARGSVRRQFVGNTAAIWAVAWSPQSRELLTGGEDGTVRYWDLAAQPRPAYAVLPTSSWILGLAFLPDSQSFLTVTQPEGVVERRDTRTLQRIESLEALGADHCSLDLSPDGRWLAVADTNGLIQIWDYRTRKLATNLVFAGRWVIGALFSPRGRYLVAAGALPDMTKDPRFWEAPAWSQVSLQGISLDHLFGFDFSPREPTVAIGYSDGTAGWWNLETRRPEATLRYRDGGALHVRFSPDGRWFATAGVNGLLTLWEVATRTPTLVGPNYPTERQALVFSPDGERLIATGASPTEIGRVWDVATGRCLATLPGEPDRFYAWLGFSPDGNTLFAASLEGTVVFWHAPSWEEIAAAESGPGKP